MNIDSSTLSQTCFDLSKKITTILFEGSTRLGNLAIPTQIAVYPYFHSFLQQDALQTYDMSLQILSESLANNLLADVQKIRHDAIDSCLGPTAYINMAKDFGKYVYDTWGYHDFHTTSGTFTQDDIQKGMHDCFDRNWCNSGVGLWEAFQTHNSRMTTMLEQILPQIFERAATKIALNAIEQAQNYRNTMDLHEQHLFRNTQSVAVETPRPIDMDEVRDRRDAALSSARTRKIS